MQKVTIYRRLEELCHCAIDQAWFRGTDIKTDLVLYSPYYTCKDHDAILFTAYNNDIKENIIISPIKKNRKYQPQVTSEVTEKQPLKTKEKKCDKHKTELYPTNASTHITQVSTTRQFTNDEGVRCWMNVSLQLLLCGLDHLTPNIWNTLTSDFGVMLKNYRFPEIYNNTDRVMSLANMPTNEYNDPEVFFNTIESNTSQWNDIPNIFMHNILQENTMTKCSHKFEITSKKLTYTTTLPSPGTIINNYLENLSTSITSIVNNYYCETCKQSKNVRIRGANQRNKLLNHNSNFIIFKFYNNHHSNMIEIRHIISNSPIQLKDKNGNVRMYEIIAVILFLSAKKHYVAHIKHTSGPWILCNDTNINIISHDNIGMHRNGVITHILIKKTNLQQIEDDNSQIEEELNLNLDIFKNIDQ